MQSPEPAQQPDAATLRLRPLSTADAPAIAALCADPGVARMTSRMPFPYRLEDAEAFLDYVTGPESEEAAWAIESTAGGEAVFLGVAGWKPGAEGEVEIGYWIGRPFWGQGIATAAARLVLERAFDQGEIRRVRGIVFKDNPASSRVLEKLGFARTGEAEGASVARGGMAPTWLYALDRADWETLA